MNEVRLTIFIIGVLVLLGIWLHWRWLDAPDARARRSTRRATRSAPDTPPAPVAGKRRPSRTPAMEDPAPADVPEAEDAFADNPFDDSLLEEPEADTDARLEPVLDDFPEANTQSERHEPSLDASSLTELDIADEHIPVLEDVAAAGEEFPFVASETEIDDADAEPANIGESREQEEFILVLHVMAADEQPINGRHIDRVLEGLGLEFGEEGIYHYYAEPPVGDEPVQVFSVANMLEPGTFDTARLDEIATPGLALFAVLPGEYSGPRVLEEMLALARDMAEQLEAELRDGRRQPLTSERLVQIESRVRGL